MNERERERARSGPRPEVRGGKKSNKIYIIFINDANFYLILMYIYILYIYRICILFFKVKAFIFL